MGRPILTAKQLKDEISYCPDCGTFTWVVRKSRVTFGKVAACPKTNPVPTIMLHGRAYSVLQLAWLYLNGTFPCSKIVPLNGDRCDARASNLMERAARSGELTAERLHELFDYNPRTGVFTRKLRTSNRIIVGKPSGTPNSDGYLVIRVDGRKYPAHRLAWLYINGSFPAREIDHINGVRHDNRLSNLREVDRTGNTQNTHRTRLPNGNFTGVRRQANGWQARVYVSKRPVILGVFNSPEEAHLAYIEGKRRFHRTNTL